MLIPPDDGIVVVVAEHFEEVVSVRIAELGQSVDARFDKVDARFAEVDARFDEVREHFVEMRDFTTFCFDKLRSEMRVDFGRVERRLDRHEELLGEVLKEVRALKPK